MRHRSPILAWATFLAAIGASAVSSAAGLGNLSYTQQEFQTPIAYFNETTFGVAPGGSNTALVLRNVMIVMGSYDSGVPPGALHVFDITNPRSPRKLKTLVNTSETLVLREQHAMPMATIDGRDILVMPTTTGIQFFDFTDPMNPTPAGKLALAGVNGGDYDNAAWELSWSWPYVYVGGTGNGVYVVDATNPAAPQLARRIATGELGNFRVGPVHAAGNYLVASGMDQGPTKVAVLDVSTPSAPFLMITGTAPFEMYSALVIGDRIFGAGASGHYSFLGWSPTAVTVIAQKTFGSDKGGYCTYQDGFGFCGQSSEGFRKVDMRNEDNIVEVGRGDIPNDTAADTDFATVLGNLVYLGNDHGTGAAFIPHSMAPDTTPPRVQKAYPLDGAVNQPLSTRVTVFFSDEIDIDSISSANLTVRKLGGAPLAGVFSHSSFNAVSFGPRAPLERNSTYEIVIPAGGLKDLAGNALTAPSIARFSTGPIIDPSTGGGGMGPGGAGGASAGAAGAMGGGLGGAGPLGGTGGLGGTSDAGAAGTGVAGAGGSGTGGTVVTGGAGGAAGSSPNAGRAGSTSIAGSNAAGSNAAGASPTGGAAGESPVLDDPSPDPSGCGCTVAGRATTGTFIASLLGAALLAVRRRRSKSKPDA
jgi:MYXO-CTERM domain-containing protein